MNNGPILKVKSTLLHHEWFFFAYKVQCRTSTRTYFGNDRGGMVGGADRKLYRRPKWRVLQFRTSVLIVFKLQIYGPDDAKQKKEHKTSESVPCITVGKGAVRRELVREASRKNFLPLILGPPTTCWLPLRLGLYRLYIGWKVTEDIHRLLRSVT